MRLKRVATVSRSRIQETNHSKYLSFGVNLIQDLTFYYENASLINKQKLDWFNFP